MAALLLIGQIVLGRVDTGIVGHVLEVRAGLCREASRQLTVHLVVNGTATPDRFAATMPEDWSATLCGLARQKDEWVAREERAAMSLVVRDAPMGGGSHGALISVAAGFEHVHRAHALFLEVGGVARRVWDRNDGVGPSMSWAIPSSSGIDFVYQLSWRPDLLEDLPDAWKGERIEWNPAAKGIARSRLRAYAMIAGTYSTIAAARAEQVALDSKCRVPRLLVLETDEFVKLTPKKVALASIATTTRAARDALIELRRCGVQGYVKRAQ